MKINKEVSKYGTIRYRNEQGQWHREDGPARVYADGSKEWWINGKLHREDGPAIEYVSGHKVWFLNGEELTEQEFNDFLLKKRLKKILEL